MEKNKLMSDSKFYMGYSRWIDGQSRYETWEESVKRVMDMHREKYKNQMTWELADLIQEAQDAYDDKLVLGAQRALQFGGEQLLKHNARLYNCAFSYCDRVDFFKETMYLLLCGAGVGFSVQNHHIAKLPVVQERNRKNVVFTIPDSIEGWAESFEVLLKSYFKGTKSVVFDFSEIRPKGALISGGFKAPGSDGLRKALEKCNDILLRSVGKQLSSLDCYDFVMHMSDAVLSGGVRRSATICLFDKDDQVMLTAKTGDWFVNNPQRARSNNSAMLVRSELTKEEFKNIIKSVKDFGEPGFIFTDNKEIGFNPCAEIGFYPVDIKTGHSGFQMCNLSEINGGMTTDEETFYKACKAASILGTLQAGYTDFGGNLTKYSESIIKREALIGVSITGWMNNPELLFNETILEKGAEIVKETNKLVAKILGINAAARTTTVKPSGNASTLLGCASGIHGEHSSRYFRNVQMNESDDVLALITAKNPKMVEKSVWSSSGTDSVVSFPIVTTDGSIFKKDLLGVKQLEYVKKAQIHWVNTGKNPELCTLPELSNNVSNTITVDNWDEVTDYLYDNKEYFAGVSLLASAGDRAYAQAPFTEVFTAETILKNYGTGALFASGVIVDGLSAFNNNLWLACDTVLGFGEKLDMEDKKDLLKRDWVRRVIKFSDNYFNKDLERTISCLKDCFNLHKWESINNAYQDIDFVSQLQQKIIDSTTMGAQACSGGACEIEF